MFAGHVGFSCGWQVFPLLGTVFPIEYLYFCTICFLWGGFAMVHKKLAVFFSFVVACFTMFYLYLLTSVWSTISLICGRDCMYFLDVVSFVTSITFSLMSAVLCFPFALFMRWSICKETALFMG